VDLERVVLQKKQKRQERGDDSRSVHNQQRKEGGEDMAEDAKPTAVERCPTCHAVMTEALRRLDTAKKKPKPFKNDRPKSLLSFLFYVTYDETVFEWFHNAPDEVPENFGLSSEVQAIIAEMGDGHKGSATDKANVVKKLMPYLEEEILKEHYKEIW
jgi:hypothetical protein